MPTSDEDLQKKQDSVAKLRESLDAELAKERENQQLVANDVTAAELDAEEARLKAQLAEVRGRNSRTALKSASAPLVEGAKEEVKHQKLVEKAASAGLDTNAKE